MDHFNPFPNKSWFLCVSSTRLLKTLWENEKLPVTSNFSSSHSVFYSFGELSANFIQFEIVVCKLSIWKSLKFVVWERVNHYSSEKNRFVIHSLSMQQTDNILQYWRLFIALKHYTVYFNVFTATGKNKTCFCKQLTLYQTTILKTCPN